jgi:hypothetical protein
MEIRNHSTKRYVTMIAAICFSMLATIAWLIIIRKIEAPFL